MKTLLAAALLAALCAGAQSQPVPGSDVNQHTTQPSQPQSSYAEAMEKAIAAVEPPSRYSSANNPYKEQEPGGVSRLRGGLESWLFRMAEDPIALFTLVLAVFTVLLWKSTNRLATGSEKTAERQLRAYLSIKEAVLSMEGQAVHVLLNVHNCGQTPAYKTTTFVRAVTLTIGSPVPVPLITDGKDWPGSLIGPGAFIHAVDRLLYEGPTPIIDALNQGSAIIAVTGTIRYVDAFDYPRHLTFQLKSVRNHEGGWSLGSTADGYEAA